MNSANDEKGLAKIWTPKRTYLKSGLTTTMVNHGV
jgi:hypothetical protein